MNKQERGENTMLPTIFPKDINVKNHFWNAFDNTETEVSARWIVRYMQEKGNWVPFTTEEIRDFQNKILQENYQREFCFNDLLEYESDRRTIKDGNWIRQNKNGKLEVTQNFVDRCYKSSPLLPLHPPNPRQ